ncbi:ABC transporter B family member 11-like protein [Tanacetum coccineum]
MKLKRKSDACEVDKEVMVASFAREKKAVADYDNSLKDAYTSSVNEGLAAGLGLGSMLSIIYFSYALAVCTIRNASVCLSAFAAGRAAASKMF